MSNRVCPTCGEEYSTTYRTCPFCEEEKAIRQGRPPHRQGGKRLEKQRARASGGAGGVLLLLTAVIIAGALAYVFLGDKIAGTIGIRSDPAELGLTDDEDQDKDVQEPVPPAGALTVSQTSMTLAAGETALLTASGVEGEAVWSSSDEQIATVADGAVTARAGGTVTIPVTISGESAACIVEVTGDPPVQMKVSGTDSPVTWASKNTSVVTVSDTGLVTRVGSGTTKVTATVDGRTLECTVRVP